jgi:hypothetical protein
MSRQTAFPMCPWSDGVALHEHAVAEQLGQPAPNRRHAHARVRGDLAGAQAAAGLLAHRDQDAVA